MRNLALLAVAAALCAAPAAAQTVQTGTTDWDQLPHLKKSGRLLELSPLIDWTSRILAKPECKLRGQRPDRFDIDVPYAALVEPDGTVKRIVIPEMGCPELNTMVGSAIMEMVRRGDIKPTGQDRAYWFGDRLAFARE